MLNKLFKEYPTIEGWCTEFKAKKMLEYLPSDAKLCVEFGVWGGKSLLPISISCKGTVIGIDAWSPDASLEGSNDLANDEWWKKIDYDHFYKYTQNLLNKYNCTNTKLWRMKSVEAFLKFEENSIDFLHQDSNHSEEISCAEVELYCFKVKPGGIWVFDDTNWPTTQKAQGLLESKGYTVLYDNSDWKIYKRNT